MKPSPGRIVLFNVPNVGWRPMMVTSVGGPTKWAVGEGENPAYVNGWAKLCPTDCRDRGLMNRLNEEFDPWPVVANEYPVSAAYEGEDPGCWRWPPRI